MNQLEIEVEIMRAAGLGDEEIAKLAELKKRADAGEVDELTTDYKRRMFQKRRFEAGDLTDDFKPGDGERYAAIIEQGRSLVKTSDEPSLEDKRIVFLAFRHVAGRMTPETAPVRDPNGTLMTVDRAIAHGELLLNRKN